MFVKLRHVHGENLKELEALVQTIKQSIVITGVNNVSGVWYIHYLIQDSITDSEPMPIKLESAPKLKRSK